MADSKSRRQMKKKKQHSAKSDGKEYNMIKLLKAVAAYRASHGIRPTSRKVIFNFFEEVKDFVPVGLSETELRKKLYSEMNSFRKKPKPGPNCPDSERRLYELELKAWDLPAYFRNAKPDDSSTSVELNQKDHNVMEKKQIAVKKRKRG